MRKASVLIIFIAAILLSGACTRNNQHGKQQNNIYKGLYSFGPEVKSFKECNADHEYWVQDQSKRLELEYSGLGFEKPYEPVYVEIEADKIPSGQDGKGAEYDSTLVVRRLIKISREIPQDMCE